MATEIKVSGKKCFDGNSLVNKYDLLALEQKSEGLTEERILLTFQAFDELIPNLGVFTRIFQKLREDLFGAVYSDELTGSADGHGCGNGEYIQRLPYFSLVRQVHNERHELAEELQGKLDVIDKRLLDQFKQLGEAQQTIADKEDVIADLNAKIDKLVSVIENKDTQINELKDELETTRENTRSNEFQLTCEIRELKEALEEAKNDIKFLSHFKKVYDNLHNAFMDKSGAFENESKENKKSMISTKRFNLLSGIESGQKLEKQMLSLMNIVMEEYDTFIETHKLSQSEAIVSDDMSSANQNFKNQTLFEQELENVQIKFQNSVSKLMSELGLLKQHNTMLIEQLQNLEEAQPVVWKEKAERDLVNSGKFRLPGDLLAMQEEMLNPFISHERVFSKYAAMLFTSNDNGKTFEVITDTKYCASCGEKTLICPHKISGPDTIFTLPHNCSHIKLTRPIVRISKYILNDIENLQSLHSALDVVPPVSSSVHGYPPDQRQNKPANLETKLSEKIPSVEDEPVCMVHSVQRLWDDYRERAKTERALPRPLDLERTRSLMEQFLGYLVWTDEFMIDQEANMSILNAFYSFMTSRYVVNDVVFMAAHDFLSAIVKFSEVDKMIQLLVHVFVGNLDAACLRYVLLIFDYISAVTWKEVEDFRPFSSVIYPFLNDDDLESLQMSYTAYSENRISGHLVSSFIIHLIQNNREPRFQDLENKLLQFQCCKRAQLTESEFKEAFESILPLCSELTRRRLHLQSERAVEWDGIVDAVPIMRLAQISGYLELHQITGLVKKMVAERVYQWRERPKSAVPVPKLTAEVMSDNINQDKLLTMGHMKWLAANLTRQVQQKEERKYGTLAVTR